MWHGDPVRYVIIGAGAVGGTIGGLLAHAGRDVVLVARGAHLDAVRTDGLRLTTMSGEVTVRCPVAAGPQDIDLRPDDVLVLAVKSQDTAAALAQWSVRPVAGGGLAGEELLLVCAQNGVDNERSALRRFARVVGMCVWLPATFLEPGRVSAGGTPVPGILTLGSIPASAEADPALRTVAGDLEAAGFRAPVSDDVMTWKYAKLLDNLGNAVDALCGTQRDDGIRTLVRTARAEAEAALAAAGITPVDQDVQARARDGFTLAELPGDSRGGSSSWQSLQRGVGTIEAAYLNGEISMLGRLHGVPTPVNTTLLLLADAAAARGDRPGGWRADDILAAASRA